MACVVVSRNGRGQPWRHEDRERAEEHPLTQYGDAVVCGPEDVFREYNLLELPHLLTIAGDDGELRRRITEFRDGLGAAPDRVQLDQVRERWAAVIWQRLLELAQTAPTDPREICDLIRKDRIEESNVAKAAAKKASTKVQAAVKTGAKAQVAAGGEGLAQMKQNAPARKVAGYAPTAKISFGADNDGKPYGKDNNPKRAGSAAAETFSLYKAGMTIQGALDAGIPSNDIAFNAKRGYIKVTE